MAGRGGRAQLPVIRNKLAREVDEALGELSRLTFAGAGDENARPNDGDPGRARTCSLQVRSLLLYPLSYGS